LRGKKTEGRTSFFALGGGNVPFFRRKGKGDSLPLGGKFCRTEAKEVKERGKTQGGRGISCAPTREGDLPRWGGEQFSPHRGQTLFFTDCKGRLKELKRMLRDFSFTRKAPLLCLLLNKRGKAVPGGRGTLSFSFWEDRRSLLSVGEGTGKKDLALIDRKNPAPPRGEGKGKKKSLLAVRRGKKGACSLGKRERGLFLREGETPALQEQGFSGGEHSSTREHKV